MSQAPDADSSDDTNAFTCGTLLACLCIPGLSKKKAEESAKSRRQPTGPEQDQPTEAARDHPQLPSRAASLEKLESSSFYSWSNIVFDFLAVEPGTEGAVHGYCPSPCFDLPVDLIRTGERRGVDEAPPVTSAFVFGGYRDGAVLKKMASCLASGVVVDGREARRPAHLVRFLSASDSGVPVRPAVTSVGPAKGG